MKIICIRWAVGFGWLGRRRLSFRREDGVGCDGLLDELNARSWSESRSGMRERNS